jgi:hypothetical protein
MIHKIKYLYPYKYNFALSLPLLMYLKLLNTFCGQIFNNFFGAEKLSITKIQIKL